MVGGTTNQKALEGALKKASISASVIAVSNRDDGIAQLQAGTVDAFAGDKILLVGLAPKVKDPANYEMLQEDLGFEPYAIVLPRGDWAFRLAVNTALAEAYRSNKILEIYAAWFSGAGPRPNVLIGAVYMLGALAPD